LRRTEEKFQNRLVAGTSLDIPKRLVFLVGLDLRGSVLGYLSICRKGSFAEGSVLTSLEELDESFESTSVLAFNFYPTSAGMLAGSFDPGLVHKKVVSTPTVENRNPFVFDLPFDLMWRKNTHEKPDPEYHLKK
jgi:hypothetical protein